MSKRKYTILFIFLAAILVFISLLRLCLEHYRPITKTDKWEATITVDENVKSIDVYKMAGFENRLLVRLPDELRQRYEWFGIYKYGVTEYKYYVSRLSGVRTFPYRHYNHDKAFGVALDDPKTEDSWVIEQTKDTVDFHNADFKISLRKRSSQ
ncbi:hypothetical protein JIN77_00285 [Verrucomicrobiaceae bacterium R5-34]|uniref:Uncharacterized protein n=1 Tax=Oceaniferula flava TaxID=2800421 RepID=A0AAE2SBT3_9BACT|nr:hypothetical protein [Oceaniferula flavus]MBK1829149.1 hypothetical protein [Verrucomicrobiaceae bacterium R5-34]MBK1853386.1 hypothetical protein [Oceaniferula flavus]MBM1134691.1 hypothetical protein [Oceaniferula flavus]